MLKDDLNIFKIWPHMDCDEWYYRRPSQYIGTEDLVDKPSEFIDVYDSDYSI